jgi:hypothetical protein
MLPATVIMCAGLWLVWRGRWPRRVGQTPHCAHCDYILTGLSGAERCPECGSSLAGRGTTYGEYPRRKGLDWVGLLLVVLTIAFMAAAGPLSRVQWYHYRPFGWVLKDLDVPGLQPRADAEIRRRLNANELSAAQVSAWLDHLLAQPSPLTPAEWSELARRSADGTLSAAQQRAWASRLIPDLDGSTQDSRRAAAELWRLARAGQLPSEVTAALDERALKEQASLADPPADPELIDYLGARFADHALSPEQQRRFLANVNRLGLEVRPAVGRDDRVPYHITTGGHGPQTWRRRVQCLGVWVDGRKVSDGGFSSTGGISGSGWTGSAIGRQPPGKHTLRVTVQATLGLSDRGVDGNDPLDRSTVDLTAPFEVLDGETAVALVTSPDAATMAKRVRAAQFRYEPSQYDPLSGMIYLDRPPVDVAFEAFARLPDGREYKLGTVAAPKGANGGWTVGAHEKPPPFAPRIDVILRSSPAAARETTGITQIWNGEVVLKDVPVEQPATRPAK